MGQQILAGLDIMAYWMKMRDFLETSPVKPFNILMFLGLVAMIWYRKWADASQEQQRAKKVRTVRLESASRFPPIEPLEDFEWDKTESLQLRPYKPKYHLTMALENLEPSELIPMDMTYKERIDLRRQLLRDHHDVVIGVNKNKSGEEDRRTRAAVSELYEFVMGTYLPTRYPKMFKLREADLEMGKTFFVQNQITREMFPTTLSPSRPTATALENLAKTVDEDILVLLPEVKRSKSEKKSRKHGEKEKSSQQPNSPASNTEENKYILEAYVACFPSGFDTRTKLGKRLNQVHSPVPGYKQRLEKSMDRFFAKLEEGKFVKRANWTVTTDADLFSAFGQVHSQEGEALRQLKMEELDLDNQIKDEGSGDDLVVAIEGLENGNEPLMAQYKRVPAWGEAVKQYLRS
ncbi:hypothetical protein PRK78_000565 [Emydomyces testavorans]|uniref:Uncharacterized protein n=1 Tax=Emydomyces testavorans TaxID=2070801 RepID=A0AAF0IFR6_9EURO|nr:hypothetical protein PRK78_000565 [Emydomyces testavorans]